MEEKDALIDAIERSERQFLRLSARERSVGLMALDLTMQQLKVLMVLQMEDSVPANDLARRLGVGLATATGIVDRLVARGLVRRREDPSDRRVRRVEMTGEGLRVIQEVSDAGRERKRRVLHRLDTGTLRDLARIMDEVYAALEADVAESGEDRELDVS
ncbi:MarR family winged helix-turn-helix transcriptional regulator [Bailinhaonella thermotolerans]|uniref:MarR family transcriptional regulator n=1 Tax=Bailinhaonella thermotolerans TaxID=1070861 RepID=A0A3A4ARH8_9ACTN|nr:MarR family transcriptional regulator [Bailinhaonella thermotolerans]RJL31721.1 MarR family transcriptional regulator [Bailinhaonella thermotolerans]